VIGARNSGDLLFTDEFGSAGKRDVRLVLATDDGSEGFKGLATQAAEELMARERFDSLYACGPEPMLVGLFELAMRNKVDMQVSLERFMKCGCGICGTCATDPDGQMVCVDGPVFNRRDLANLTEFGIYRRDQMGIRRKIQSV
jgi:dihydroorotate dehydrogenase electron transfer subunit